VAWGLGAYRFRRYKSGDGEEVAQLKVPRGVDHARALSVTEGVWLGRDLINTPASDLGPQELEDAARQLAKKHGASVSSIVGDDLLAKNFPMIHAVGRASDRPPRLIDLRWEGPGSRAGAAMVTLVGKGICFDTGGLDIKPASGMLMMKKDMGGAATVLANDNRALFSRLQVLGQRSHLGHGERPIKRRLRAFRGRRVLGADRHALRADHRFVGPQQTVELDRRLVIGCGRGIRDDPVERIRHLRIQRRAPDAPVHRIQLVAIVQGVAGRAKV
jgi:hypothetical protein